ncbi:probable G-protein coupled receptor B0563.6 [Haliotis rufescens]|uniref:probable G-protein coupled receptor B0563.6 n=1 Tax=Haliotis rufescens TaxID=6454 RepID=UPI00201F76D7|nr:probable G-protein coupled receptor B0563.6 [Haliotis rufescens]
MTSTSSLLDTTDESHSMAVDGSSSIVFSPSTAKARYRAEMTTATIHNTTDMDDNGNNTANEEVMKPKSPFSPFALIHSGSVAEATYKSFFLLTENITLPLYLIALATNICNVIVFCQKRMRSPTSTILLAMCISQVLYLSCTLVTKTMRYIYGKEVESVRFYKLYGLYVNLYVAVALGRLGFCYNFLLSAERFIAVTFPLQAKSMRLVKNPSVVCVLIMVASFVGHIFSPMKFYVKPYSTSDNITVYRYASSPLYVKYEVHFMNCSLASQFIFVYFMLLGCLVFNFLIVISLRRHSKARQSMKTTQNTGDAQKKEMQTTITIMASTVVVVILALPSNANSFASSFNDDYGLFTREHYLFSLVTMVGGICQLVSNFTNFFFYIALSATFRKTFIQVFIPCATSGKSAKSTVTGTSNLGTVSADISRRN